MPLEIGPTMCVSECARATTKEEIVSKAAKAANAEEEIYRLPTISIAHHVSVKMGAVALLAEFVFYTGAPGCGRYRM